MGILAQQHLQGLAPVARGHPFRYSQGNAADTRAERRTSGQREHPRVSRTPFIAYRIQQRARIVCTHAIG